MNGRPPSPGEGKARKFKTHSHDETVAMGHRLGRGIDHGLTLLMVGDLGSGKTAFSQGLAHGLGVPASYTVTSPTYTLINEYPGRLPFYHVDLYRLPTPIDMDEIGLCDILDGDGVVAIEWSQRLHQSDRPPCRLDLYFDVTGENARSIIIIAYGLAPSDLLNHIDG